MSRFNPINPLLFSTFGDDDSDDDDKEEKGLTTDEFYQILNTLNYDLPANLFSQEINNLNGRIMR